MHRICWHYKSCDCRWSAPWSSHGPLCTGTMLDAVSQSGHRMSLANVSSPSSSPRLFCLLHKGDCHPTHISQEPQQGPLIPWFFTFTGLEQMLVNRLEITAPLSQQPGLKLQSPWLYLQQDHPKSFSSYWFLLVFFLKTSHYWPMDYSYVFLSLSLQLTEIFCLLNLKYL